MSKLVKLLSTQDKTNYNIIGNYRLEKTIGEGTFGKVKLGIHIPTEEKVAVKILEKDKIADKEDFERMIREINFLKKLKHPNIIKIYEIIENTKNFYIIMEYAHGGELFNLIVEKRRLDESEAAFFFYQIINGLEYIHKNNIVHRDMKPENLLLAEGRRLKIIDFGLSNQYKPGQLLQTPCGSPCYAAPEMILGRRYAGIMVDIWSTGIILYAMLCGYLPFEDKNNDKLYKKILECKYDIPDYVSSSCRELIKRILTVNPNKRIKLDEIKSHAFYKLGEESSLADTDENLNKSNGVNTVLDKMVSIGFNRQDVIANIENNKHNNITTTFDLLLNKFKLGKLESIINEEINHNTQNINININYNSKIENLNININETKKISNNVCVANEEKEKKADVNLTEPDKHRTILSGIGDNTERQPREINRLININNSPKQKAKKSTSLHKSYKTYYNSIHTLSESKDNNNSITLDLESFIKKNKNDCNNIIMGTPVLTQINRIKNKQDPRKFYDSISEAKKFHFNKDVNSSASFEESIRSPSVDKTRYTSLTNKITFPQFGRKINNVNIDLEKIKTFQNESILSNTELNESPIIKIERKHSAKKGQIINQLKSNVIVKKRSKNISVTELKLEIKSTQHNLTESDHKTIRKSSLQPHNVKLNNTIYNTNRPKDLFNLNLNQINNTNTISTEAVIYTSIDLSKNIPNTTKNKDRPIKTFAVTEYERQVPNSGRRMEPNAISTIIDLNARRAIIPKSPFKKIAEKRSFNELVSNKKNISTANDKLVSNNNSRSNVKRDKQLSGSLLGFNLSNKKQSREKIGKNSGFNDTISTPVSNKLKQTSKTKLNVTNQDKGQKSQQDFFCVTLSANKSKNVSTIISDYCKTNTLSYKEIGQSKYECGNDINIVSVEVVKFSNHKMLKLQHIRGDEALTKEIIKSMVMSIGFV